MRKLAGAGARSKRKNLTPVLPYDISIIDTDVEMIDVARSLDFKVYYGDGTRLDILHAAGAGRARVP